MWQEQRQLFRPPAGASLPDGTPVIVSGGGHVIGGGDGTVRVWRLADGAPVGEPLTGHAGPVEAVAVGSLPDGTPVIVSGGGESDGTVRVWRLADGAPLVPPLDLPESVHVAVQGDVIVTATGSDIGVHQPALPRLFCLAAVLFPGTGDRSAERSDNGRLSGTSCGEHLARTSAVTESEHLAERNSRTSGA